MSSGTPSTEVLFSWKSVRQAVGRALYTLEQFTISRVWGGAQGPGFFVSFLRGPQLAVVK